MIGCILLLLAQTALAQMLQDSSGIYPTTTEAVVYTTNSVQIETCASIPNVASSNRPNFQIALSSQLASIVSGTVFLTRVYTSSGGTGDVCFFYVYQAPNPEAARMAFAKISPQGVNSANGITITVAFNALPYTCTIASSMWQDESGQPFGVQLPFHWTADDIMLWALCGGGLLCVAAMSACCFILHYSARRETAILESVLATDQQLLTMLSKSKSKQPTRVAKAVVIHSTAKAHAQVKPANAKAHAKADTQTDEDIDD